MKRFLLLSAVTLLAALLPTSQSTAQFDTYVESYPTYNQSTRQLGYYGRAGATLQMPSGKVYRGTFSHQSQTGLPDKVLRSIPQIDGVVGQLRQSLPAGPQGNNGVRWSNDLPRPGQGSLTETLRSTTNPTGQVTKRQYRRPVQQSQSSANPQQTTRYRQPIGQAGTTKRHQGVDYDANAGIGFDQRTDSFVGGKYDSKDGGFVGAGGTIGAGLYGDAEASQSGKIGKVDVRNYASGSGFVGTEAGAKAGIGKKGLEVGANGFAGGRVSGTVGSDVGPVGYGATGEAWSGAGLEAGVNAGFDDGKLTLGAEAGAALGVGGKLGFQATVDVEKIGNGVKEFGQDAGRWTKKAGQNVSGFAKKTGQNIGSGAKKFGQGVGNTAKKAGKGIGNAAKKFGDGTKKLFKGFGKKK